MVSDRLLGAVAVAVLAVAAAVGAAALLDLPFEGGDEDGATPLLTSFTATGGNCVDSVDERGTFEVLAGENESIFVVTDNVSVPGAHYTLDSPRLVETGPGNYSLNVTWSESGEKPSRNCTAQASYVATIRVPGEAGATTVVVRHGDRIVARGYVANGGGSPSENATQTPA